MVVGEGLVAGWCALEEGAVGAGDGDVAVDVALEAVAAFVAEVVVEPAQQAEPGEGGGPGGVVAVDVVGVGPVDGCIAAGVDAALVSFAEGSSFSAVGVAVGARNGDDVVAAVQPEGGEHGGDVAFAHEPFGGGTRDGGAVVDLTSSPVQVGGAFDGLAGEFAVVDDDGDGGSGFAVFEPGS